MLGKPKFNFGDRVSCVFTGDDGKDFTVIGTVEIIDIWGTFEQKEEVSYDFMVEDWRGSGTPVFVKHIRESELQKVD